MPPPLGMASTSTASISPSHDNPSFIITPVRSPSDLSAARDLILSYVTWLDIDLTFQNFEAELASLPGAYAPPSGGEILLARSKIQPGLIDETSSSGIGSGQSEGAPLGMVALRALPSRYHAASSSDVSDSLVRVCEMKRLWVTEAGRGTWAWVELLFAQFWWSRNRLGYTEDPPRYARWREDDRCPEALCGVWVSR